MSLPIKCFVFLAAITLLFTAEYIAARDNYVNVDKRMVNICLNYSGINQCKILPTFVGTAL